MGSLQGECAYTAVQEVGIVTLGSRLRELRAEQRLTQGQVAVRAHMDRAYLSQLENDDVPSPSGKLLVDLANALRVDVKELLIAAGYPVEPDRSQTAPSASPFGPVVLIPLVNISLSAGMTVYGETREAVPIQADLVAGKNLVAARVTGDCMEPEIMAGDVAIVDISDRAPRPGRLVAILLEDGSMVVKRLEHDAAGSVLVDNKGGSYRPNGGRVQGTIVSVVRTYR